MRRVTVSLDCDDKEADVVARRVATYLGSLGALNVQVLKIEDLYESPSKK